jgi:hypothetical protein
MCGSCLRDTDNNSSDYITYNTLQYRGSQKNNNNNTDYWFSKYNRILHHYSVSTAAATAAALCYQR